MNYNYLNRLHQYWRKEIFPHLSHRYHVASFDDYLRKFSFLPSGKWLQTLEKVKLAKTIFLVDPKKFVKKYKDVCITYNAPSRPEDGFQRIIYQISPTLHVEAALWLWIEHEILQAYILTFSCYHEEIEYLEFLDEIYKMRREGNTEEKAPGGFAEFVKTASAEKKTKPSFAKGENGEHLTNGKNGV